jgi:hypothetical protein
MMISKLMGIGTCTLALTFGCADRPDNPADADDRNANDPSQAAISLEHDHQFTIHGTGTLFGVTSSGIVSRPLDLSAAQFAAYSLSHGELVREVGVGEADGTFTVPVVAGARSWELETNLFGTPYVAIGNAREPNVSQHVLGRLDGALPTAETDVSISITGLTPWADGDSTQIVAANNGAVVFSPELQFAAPPAAGDTSISAQTIDWMAQFPPDPLVEAAKGDVAVMSQLVARTSGTEVYSGLDRIGTATGFTQTNGVASAMTVAMSAVPQKSFTLHWQGSAFEALRSDVGAGAADTPGGQGAFIDALPDAAKFGFYTTSPDLMLYTPTSGSANVDITVSYGNPYSTQGKPWDEYAIINYFFAVPVHLGAAAPYHELVGYDANMALGELHGGIVKPLISPVREVRIAGKDLRLPQTGVGLSPTVRWDAPAIGRATQYFIALKRLTATSTGTSGTTVARFVTKDRTLRIPSTYLASGTTYILSMTAIDFGNVDRTTDLFGDGLPFESASSITSTFTP